MAGRIPRVFINDLLARTDIVDLIDARVKLKKQGKNFHACCPFHNEKTPSFTVNGEKQFYHCFGCGAHGNAIDFLMNYDKLEFVETVEELAAMHNLEVPFEAGSGPSQIERHQRQTLYQLMDGLNTFYQQSLQQPVATCGGGYGRPQGGGYGNNRGGGFRQHTPGYDPNAKYSMKKRIEYKEENIDPAEPLRLNKFLANAGVCSRREADEFIQAGLVTVNGQVVTELGTKILRTDEVKFHDAVVSLEKKVYVLLNKPKDYVTTSDDPQQRKTVMDLVKDVCPERIYPVGRLDRNTTGVLLLTNDGDLASKLTHPKFLKKKVYHVHLDKNLTAHDMQQISEGITLEDGEIKADAVAYADERDKSQVGIEIHSGKNRIVRRIFESLGYRVTKLDRVQFAGLTKKNLRRGDWRFLTEKEVDMLRMGAFE